MIHAIRSARNHPIQRSFSSSTSTIAAPVLSKRTCSIRFKGNASLSSQQESAHIMDKAEHQETGDVMYHSFGHEYATRCEDEGFGVVHSTKQSETDDTHGSQPANSCTTLLHDITTVEPTTPSPLCLSDKEKKQGTPADEEKVQHRTKK